MCEIVPWCNVLQANVSLSLLGKFSLSLLEMQQSPGDCEQTDGENDHKHTHMLTSGALQTRAHFTLCAAADVILADLSQLLFVLTGSVRTTAAVV